MALSDDPHDLSRFVRAQEDDYEPALSEIAPKTLDECVAGLERFLTVTFDRISP